MILGNNCGMEVNRKNTVSQETAVHVMGNRSLKYNLETTTLMYVPDWSITSIAGYIVDVKKWNNSTSQGWIFSGRLACWYLEVLHRKWGNNLEYLFMNQRQKLGSVKEAEKKTLGLLHLVLKITEDILKGGNNKWRYFNKTGRKMNSTEYNRGK